MIDTTGLCLDCDTFTVDGYDPHFDNHKAVTFINHECKGATK